MLEIVRRGMSIQLGLGLLVGGIWGPSVKMDALIAGLALFVAGMVPAEKLWNRSVVMLALAGVLCMLIRIGILVNEAGTRGELILQIGVLSLCVAILLSPIVREAKERFGAHGRPR